MILFFDFRESTRFPSYSPNNCLNRFFFMGNILSCSPVDSTFHFIIFRTSTGEIPCGDTVTDYTIVIVQVGLTLVLLHQIAPFLKVYKFRRIFNRYLRKKTACAVQSISEGPDLAVNSNGSNAVFPKLLDWYLITSTLTSRSMIPKRDQMLLHQQYRLRQERSFENTISTY